MHVCLYHYAGTALFLSRLDLKADNECKRGLGQDRPEQENRTSSVTTL